MTHLSGGRRVGGSDWSKRLRSAGFVPWSLSLAFVWSRILAPQACEIWRRRRACPAESTPRSFLHAYLRARSSGDVHASYRIRDVDALGEFFLQITRSAGIIYRHYMPRQLNLRTVARMIQMQPGRRLGVSHSSTAANQPDRERACQRREAMSRPRPALLHTCEYNEVCSVEACLCRSLCHTPQRSTCRRPSCRAKCD